jgi:hypothetical protein
MVQSEHFCAADLWDESKGEYRKSIFKIVKVAQGTVTGQKGRKKGLPFLTLEDVNGNPQRAAFGANPTNCTAISAALGTPDVRKWLGHWIGLYVTKVDSPEGLVDAIRVHPQRVSPPDKKSPPPVSLAGQPAAEPPPASQPAAPELDDADKRAIELAEAEEARRGR